MLANKPRISRMVSLLHVTFPSVPCCKLNHVLRLLYSHGTARRSTLQAETCSRAAVLP